MPSFNPSQQAAIDAQNPNILVSAAAGSGKTTVMVEKILQTLLRDPEASISRFLVITFTRDAARNMKDKLRGLLEKASQEGSEPAARALSEIETASISTIHSFCAQLLKEYNDNTGAGMNPRVLKEAEKKRMLDESFADAAEMILATPGDYPPAEKKAVSELLTAFSPDEVCAMVQNLYNVLMGIPDPFVRVEALVRQPPFDLWNQEILGAISLDVLGLEEILRQENELMDSPLAHPAYEEVVQQDAALIADLLRAIPETKDPAACRALLEGARESFAKAPSLRKLDEDVKEWKKGMDRLRDGIKNANGLLMTCAKRIAAMLDERNDRLNAIIRRELWGLLLLLRETAVRYGMEKLDANAIDYADMEQVAYHIISDPEKRSELLTRYRYIYVDECQDVSGIQDAIISSLSGPGHQCFMVGDIKQSIYGFRHAEPDLFDQKRRDYSDDPLSEQRRVFFEDNYRSCRSVVDAVNEVFTEAMDKQVTDMDYLPQDNLRCNLPGDFGPVEVLLVRRGEEEADKLEEQCEAAGRFIQSLIAPSAEASREAHYQYRDIVILLRTARGVASQVVDHLRRMHIPAMYEGAPDFFGLAEIRAFVSLLTVIDNPRHDDDLAGALINTPFLFTESDLADIRLEKPEHVPFYEAWALCAERNEKPIDRKCREVSDQLEAWRKLSEAMSVPDFVWWLMRETGIYAARGAYPDGKARQANLDALYQRAVDGQRAGDMRLSDFIQELREDREARVSDSDDHPVMGSGDNFVRIMTMHKSKGLEFPAVILMDLQRSIRRKRSDEKLRIQISSAGGALGLYLPAVQRARHSVLDSQGRDAFEFRALRKSISESTRLLYVAMTRAQQKLCLIGSVKDGDEKLWRNQSRAARIWKTNSLLDMIMPAVLRRLPLPEAGQTHRDALWQVTCVEGRAITEQDTVADTVDTRIEAVLSAPAPMRMFMPEQAEPIPLKTSVTTLVRQAAVLSEEDSEETVADKRRTEEAVRTFRLSAVPTRPAFLEEEKVQATNIGTATHRFIRLIRLDALRQPEVSVKRVIEGELARMRAERILSEEEAALIRLPGVIAFFSGELGQRMLRSPDIRREADFTMRIRPGENTLVQGIVDCAFLENNEWILIDYKTDHDTAPATFVPRHAMQMNWYRTALERLTRTPVREMWLYALRAGRAYAVSRIEIE